MAFYNIMVSIPANSSLCILCREQPQHCLLQINWSNDCSCIWDIGYPGLDLILLCFSPLPYFQSYTKCFSPILNVSVPYLVFQSHAVRNCTPGLLFAVKCVDVDSKVVKSNQLVNHFGKTRHITTKVSHACFISIVLLFIQWQFTMWEWCLEVPWPPVTILYTCCGVRHGYNQGSKDRLIQGILGTSNLDQWSVVLSFVP